MLLDELFKFFWVVLSVSERCHGTELTASFMQEF